MDGDVKRTFPFEACVAPFPGESPVGEDISLSGLYEELKEMARADDPALAGGETFRPKGGWKKSEWDRVEETAIECLSTRSKDLRVARFLAQALGELHGLPGMRDGLALVRELQERYWDTLHPLPDRVRHPDTGEKILDPEPRALEVDLVVEGYRALLLGRPAAGGADEELVDAADGALAEIEALRRLAVERYFNHDSEEGLDLLAQAIRDHVAGAREEVERRRRAKEEQRAAEEARRAATERAARAAVPAEPATAPGAREAVDPADPEALLGQVGEIARAMRHLSPGWAAGYLLPLAAAWAEGRPPLSTDEEAGTLLAEARRRLEQLRAERAWAELVDEALGAVLRPWGRDWLDPAKAVVDAAEMGGIPVPIGGVGQLVLARLERDPDWPRKRLADGEVAAEPATQVWLLDLAARAEDTSDAEAEAEGSEAAKVTSDASSAAVTVREEGLSVAAREEASALLEQGSVEEAIARLESEVNAATCVRTRFLRSLDLAEWLLEKGRESLAAEIYSWMMDQIENRSLEGWEDATFLRRVYRGVLRSLPIGDPYGDAEEKRRRARAALCLVAPSWAVRYTS